MNFRASVCLLLAALSARAADESVFPLRDALARKTLAITIRGNARDQLTITVRNESKDAVAIEIPAGLVCKSDAGAVVVLRHTLLVVTGQNTAEAVLPTAARSAKNGCAAQPCVLTADTVPALDPDRKSTRLNSSHHRLSRMPSSA